MGLMNNLWAIAAAIDFTGETGEKDGTDLDKAIERATLVNGSQMCDQVSIETYLDPAVTDDDGNGIYRIRSKAGGVSNAMLAGLIAKSKLLEEYVKVSEEQPSGTAGGASVAAAWTARVINTENDDPDTIAAIAANQITLAAGTYRCLINSCFSETGATALRLRNTTAGTTLVMGLTGLGAAPNITGAVAVPLAGRFTVAGGQALEVQYYAATVRAGNGLGFDAGLGVNNVFTIAEFWRVA